MGMSAGVVLARRATCGRDRLQAGSTFGIGAMHGKHESFPCAKGNIEHWVLAMPGSASSTEVGTVLGSGLRVCPPEQIIGTARC